MRSDNRTNTDVRPIEIIRNYTTQASGCVLVSYGNTKVICSANIDNSVPRFVKNTGKGWLTAEYSLLPSSTSPRAFREATKGKVSGRTNEIQRLIGRSLRQAIDMSVLGEKSIYIDCDVIQADGGTRTAAITGGMIALELAVEKLMESGDLQENPIKDRIAAVSVGVVDGEVMCDLCYEEDFKADVDMNIVMTESGKYIEVQGTAEEAPFSPDELLDLLSSASQGITEIFKKTKA